ncbi:MAG: ATP-binding protein [Alistipes shahii]
MWRIVCDQNRLARGHRQSGTEQCGEVHRRRGRSASGPTFAATGWKFYVQDTGCGELRPRRPVRFSTASSSSTTSRQEGTGLGLGHFEDRIVERMDGEIECRFRRRAGERGSRFSDSVEHRDASVGSGAAGASSGRIRRRDPLDAACSSARIPIGVSG